MFSIIYVFLSSAYLHKSICVYTDIGNEVRRRLGGMRDGKGCERGQRGRNETGMNRVQERDLFKRACLVNQLFLEGKA